MNADDRTILVVDDHPVYRAGISALFISAGYDVVGEAASAAEAVAPARSLRPRLILMDLGLPDETGVVATARILGEQPATRVVVITMFDDDGSVRAALRAGAVGYVVKDASHAELLAAVAAASEGATVLGSGVSVDVPVTRPPTADPFGLTPRETQVLDLVMRGLTNRQIADRLGLSRKTVANNVSMLLAKCGATDRVELASIARSTFG